MKIELSSTEAKVIDWLSRFTEAPTCPTKKHLRIAGGWVRDKLLSTHCTDLDVALEDCSGLAFAEAFQRWIAKEPDGIQFSEPFVVKANPEKSKHLETAVLTIPGQDISIDFVNLRSESYADDSRIPVEMKFGTPLEDANRRDLTINSLFYNINTKCVEDHTHRGLEDLKNRLLRTPLDPLQTFLDDPLRVVRSARFLATIPNSRPDPDLGAAASRPEVLAALVSKVSIERVRQELQKALKAKKPSIMLRYLNDWGVLSKLFTFDAHGIRPKESPAVSLKNLFPESPSSFSTIPSTPTEVQQLFRYGIALMCIVEQLLHLHLPKSHWYWDGETRYKMEGLGAALYGAFFLPFAQFVLIETDNATLMYHLLAVQLKSPNVAIECQKLLEVVEVTVPLVLEDSIQCLNEYAARMVSMNGAAKWAEVALVLTACLHQWHESSPLLNYFGQVPDNQTLLAALEGGKQDLWLAIDEWINTVMQRAKPKDQVWLLKPLFDGRELTKTVLPGLTAGPVLGTITRAQMKWLASKYDSSCDPEELRPDLLEFLRTEFGSYAH